MVTGNNIITEEAITKECIILGDDIEPKNLDNNQIEGNPEHMNVTTKK